MITNVLSGLKKLCCIEVIIGLLIPYTYMYADIFRLNWRLSETIDLVVIEIVFFAILYKLIQMKCIAFNKGHYTMVLLFIYLLCTVFWTKYLYFYTVANYYGLVFLLSYVMLASYCRSVEKIFVGCLLGALILIIFYSDSIRYYDKFNKGLILNYISAGTIFGFSFIFLYWQTLKSNKSLRTVMFVLSLLLFWELIWTASRGAMFACVVSLAVLVWLQFKLTNSIRPIVKYFAILAVCTAIVIMSGVFSAEFGRTFSRYGDSSMAELKKGVDYSRWSFYGLSYDMWKESPWIGQGIGTFGLRYMGEIDTYHPHNVFLEVMNDGGLVGVVMLLSLFYLAIKKARWLYRSRVECCDLAIAGTVFCFCDALLAGDYWANVGLWIMLAVLFTMGEQKKEIADKPRKLWEGIGWRRLKKQD